MTILQKINISGRYGKGLYIVSAIMTLAASGLVVFYPFILPACIILKMLSIPVLLYPTAIALKTAYDGKYGAPSAGAPKVFVKYFYVNTATGEKSGEMLGVATLSSSEEDGD